MTIAGDRTGSQPIDAVTLGTLGIFRLNLGSGRHVARDYGDPRSLYIDEEAPSGTVSPHPSDPRLVLVDNRFTYLQCAIPPLPIESASVREVICEHLIEHLTPASALALCREVRRVLMSGGVFRISTPDLRRYVDAFSSGPDSSGFVRSRWSKLQPVLAQLPDRGRFSFGEPLVDNTPRPALLLNQLFYLWGHAWIYDSAEVAHLLAAAGFDASAVHEVSFRQGMLGSLAQWDTEYRSDESLYVEAVAR